MAAVKYKTVGGPLGSIDPKLITQLISSVIAWALARYIPGLKLPPEAEMAIAAFVGVVVGYISPAPRTVPVNAGPAVVESGQGAGV